MSLYITISAGERPETARPVLALGDQRLIRKMLALVPQALGLGAEQDKRPSSATPPRKAVPA